MMSSTRMGASKRITAAKLSVIALAGVFAAGCPITEKPGSGVQLSLKEPESERLYYLYKPVDYDPNKSYPLVISLHALAPFDSAKRQIEEWQNSADKYGLIVAAPKMANADFHHLPLYMLLNAANQVNWDMKADEQVVMNMLDEVLSKTSADPKRVMITGLSSSGTLMYYIANRHPDRFSALCARSAWFNPNILDEDVARQMAKDGFRVFIHYAEYDNVNIKLDSWKARRWHEEMGFDVEWAVFPETYRLPGWGHVQGTVPTLAAEFFARPYQNE